MNWISQLLFLIVGYCATLLGAPTELQGQRSQPMGNVKSSQHANYVAPFAPTTYQYLLPNLPPRFQWFANSGYCGEVSLISAGLKYGQYVSQYTARATVGSQSREILLGVNDNTAADAMHLRYATRWNAQDTPGFLTWIKAYLLNGYPVIIGVYTNQCLFYDKCGGSRTQGDPEYDHIVPVLGILSLQPLTPPPLPPAALPPYIGTDSIIFSDNGLQGPEDGPTNPPCTPNPANPYHFTYTFDQFQATRKRANTNNQWYSLSKETNTYGIAILGIRDDNHDTIPITVETNTSSSCPLSGPINYEYPCIVDGSNQQPTPMPLTLTVTVTIPDQTKTYNLYRYSALSQIPNSQFNANASNASQTWVIAPGSGSTYVLTESILSNEVAAYRAVENTAP